MCGSRLSQVTSSVAIDDNDPPEIETPAYRFDERSASQEPMQFRERDRRREIARDATRPPGSNGRPNRSSPTIANLPPDTAQEEAAEELRTRKATNRRAGIGGPSFLGLGYEGSDDGFVYDKPRDDGFVYDTDVAPPQYLLEEVPRGVSWRAWALFLLLVIGAGLGYVQWRASHHQGFPDVASILARNGPTVDPSGPDMTNNNGKTAPKAQAPASNSSAADSAKDEQASTSDEGKAKGSSESEDSAAKESAEAKNPGATDKVAKTEKTAKPDEDAADENSAGKSAKGSTAKPSDENSDQSAKPESDGPVAKATKSKRAQTAPVEARQPKSLGEKDPLIVQADKYLRGRGAQKNCSAAVNLLRQASSAGNPSADVKMGALYWSGTCVTQSNVSAYQWFARAHSLEPNNRWIERSRSSLWATLTPAERRRIGY